MAIQTNSLWSYPASFIKQGIIATAAGGISAVSAASLLSACQSGTSKLSDYLCVQSKHFFNPQNISLYLPFVTFTDEIFSFVQPYLPALSMFKVDLGSALCVCTAHIEVLTVFACIEELVYRVGLQKISLLSASKLVPSPLGKIVSHPISRILIASSIFALIHENTLTLSPFIGGLIYGTLFEKYGFIAASTAHIACNFFIFIECFKKI